MSRKTIAVVALAAALSGCAVAPLGSPAQFSLENRIVPDPIHPRLLERSSRPAPELQKAHDRENGLRSVFFAPAPVDSLVALGASARSRVFLGALFATRMVGSSEVAGLALVLQAVGGGLGPTLSVRPTLRLEVDGDPLVRGPVLDPRLYTVGKGPWGLVETLMIPVEPALLKTVAEGADVKITLGDSMEFVLGQDQLSGFAALLAEIPEDTHFGSRAAASPRKVFVTD